MPPQSPPQSPPQPSGSIFTRKFGPLPGWGWAAVVAGGAFVFMYWRSKKAASSTADEAATMDGTQTIDGQYYQPYQNPGTVPPSDPGTTPGPLPTDTSAVPFPAGTQVTHVVYRKDPTGRSRQVAPPNGHWIKCSRARSANGWCWAAGPWRGQYVRTIPYTVQPQTVPGPGTPPVYGAEAQRIPQSEAA